MINSQQLQSLPELGTFDITPDNENLVICSARGNPSLASEVANYLDCPLHPLETKDFADGEIYTRFGNSIRGKTVFIIQSFGDEDVNKRLMETVLLVDAAKGASAERVIVLFPYYPYSRQDRKSRGREPISARVIPRTLESVGVDRFVSLDLHSPQIQGFATVPFDCASGMPILAKFVREHLELNNATVVSPDVGGVSRARTFAKYLGGDTSLSIIDKHRQHHNQAEVLEVIGDVEGKTALIVDDIIDTAGTITQGAAMLKQRGAKKVSAIATHGLFSPPAKTRLDESEIEDIIVTNSLALPAEKCPANLHIVSVSQLLGDMIWRIYTKQSVSSLLNDGN